MLQGAGLGLGLGWCVAPKPCFSDGLCAVFEPVVAAFSQGNFVGGGLVFQQGGFEGGVEGGAGGGLGEPLFKGLIEGGGVAAVGGEVEILPPLFAADGQGRSCFDKGGQCGQAGGVPRPDVGQFGGDGEAGVVEHDECGGGVAVVGRGGELSDEPGAGEAAHEIELAGRPHLGQVAAEFVELHFFQTADVFAAAGDFQHAAEGFVTPFAAAGDFGGGGRSVCDGLDLGGDAAQADGVLRISICMAGLGVFLMC